MTGLTKMKEGVVYKIPDTPEDFICSFCGKATKTMNCPICNPNMNEEVRKMHTTKS